MNTLLFFGSLLLTFLFVVFLSKVGKKEYLIGYMGIASIFMQILTCKQVNIMGFDVQLGGPLVASIFLCSDILTEKYGEKEAKKGSIFVVIANLFYIVLGIIATKYLPNQYDSIQPIFEELFAFSIRISFASIIMLFVSNYFNVKIFAWLKNKTGGKYLWLRNNLSTIITNCGENLLFELLAFYGILPWNVIISATLLGSLMEIIMALIDTPFLYLATKTKEFELGKA